jgi:hypothetical protein
VVNPPHPDEVDERAEGGAEDQHMNGDLGDVEDQERYDP